jgi:hypothetical protein
VNRRLWLACGIAAGLAACAGSSPPPRASPTVFGAAPSVEEWEYAGQPGKLVRTHSYRLFTTETDPGIVDSLPRFLEAALDRYTSAFGPLPKPTMRLDTFLMADREQWAMLTRQVMGSQAGTYLRIQRGGFASGGRALIWTIGGRGTRAIIAHEGWHQYTQRTFRQELPAWLEEGIAVYMEGFIDGASGPVFAGWANPERYEQLRRAAARGSLLPLQTLLDSSPQHLIEHSTEGTLTYYAQLWALMHFLNEGEGGRYRRGIGLALDDAAAGRLEAMVKQRVATRGAAAGVFRSYFGPDLGPTSEEYASFIGRIMEADNADAIAAGRSPLTP